MASKALGRWAAVGVGVALLAPALVATEGAAAETILEPAGTYDQPVHVTSLPDDPDRLLVVERAGWIQLTTPEGTSEFVDLTAVVNPSPGSERGLLSVAFPPDHAETGLLYVFYTDDAGALVVAELESDGDTADPASRRTVLTIPHPGQANHNGGQLQFGPDGYLYVSTGDGGGIGDPDDNGQDPTTLLGAILRIDPRESGTEPYTVPATNPYVDPEAAPVPGTLPEIWSWGLRNPWRFSFDRETGALVIGDVGQGAREEIDYAPQEAGGGAGDNFGWNCREGTIPFSTSPECLAADPDSFVDPVHDYASDFPSCAITGGYVVRDTSLTELHGRYLYADHCAGELRSIELDLPAASGDRPEGLSVASPTSFGEDACGRIYVASLGGAVYRLAGDTEPDCDVVDPPVDVDAPVTTLRIDGAPPATSYDEPVEVTLSATDLPAGGGASGVEYIDYRLSADSQPGGWVRAANDDGDDPFATTFTVSPFGGEPALARRSPVVTSYTLEFAATDAAGNVEELAAWEFEITTGKPAPLLQLTVSPRRRRAGPSRRRVRFRVELANLGGEAVGPMTLCATAPRRRLRVVGPRCIAHPTLLAGEARRRRIALRIRRPARGKVTRVRLTAHSPSAPSARAVVRVRARR